MPQEKFKIPINFLQEVDFNQQGQQGQQSKTKSMKAFRCKYLEVDYNFYGLCQELYEEAAKKWNLSLQDIDLFVRFKDEFMNGVLFHFSIFISSL